MARTIHAACPHDCPDTCALLVTVDDAGHAVQVRGDPDHPTTAGSLCTKVAHYTERVYAPDRLLHPMKRIGKKGAGQFVRISWDEALDTVAARFSAICADDPRAIVPYSYAGTMGYVQGGSMDRRLFHRMGASFLERTICSTAGTAGYAATIGASVGMDMEEFANARLILIWGANPVVSSIHQWRILQQAKRRGARLVCIDPLRTETAQQCHQHLAPLPGTDGALALAMMQVLIAENLIDRDYIEKNTLGFEALAQRAAEWPPERAAAETGLAAADILALARDYGSIRPAAIRINYGLQRCAGGGNAVRAIACLPALIGAWREPAGGILLSSSGNFPVDGKALERPDLYPGTLPRRSINMSTIGDALLDATDPPLRAICVYNSNPLAIAPDGSKVRQGFSREDLFCVVLEQFQTDTADYADILLPATTQFEHVDVHRSYGHLYMLANQPAIAPLGEAKPNSEIFRLLAQRMGFTDACLGDSDSTIAAQAFNTDDKRSAALPSLATQGWARVNVPKPFAPFARGNFLTPSGKCEFYSAQLERQGHDPLPCYVPPHESTRGPLAQRFPLAMISPPARHFLNSSFANLSRFLEDEGRPRLLIHPEDARQRGITNEQKLRVFNDRGTFHAWAEVTERIRRGVVAAPSLWWRKLSGDGENANAVTSQALTDLGSGPTFYDCLVEVMACRPACNTVG
ncbi:MAG: molybdopterin oxidoreductase family protein [Betaproteobacteria bacterium]|nr:molybdopterin oxidoreductase family protein [Betaproteobacteria bacterium]